MCGRKGDKINTTNGNLLFRLLLFLLSRKETFNPAFFGEGSVAEDAPLYLLDIWLSRVEIIADV